MGKHSQGQRIYYWIHHGIYLSALLAMTVLVFVFGSTAYVFSLGAAMLFLFISEAMRIVSTWLYEVSDEGKKKASAITRIISFDACILFIAGLLYVDRYFLLEDNSFFYMSALFIGAMLFVLSFFRGNGWTKFNEYSLVAKIRIIGMLAMFALAAIGFGVSSYATNDFVNGYRAYMFIPFALIFVSILLIRFFQPKVRRVRLIWLLVEASYLLLASMALCFAF